MLRVRRITSGDNPRIAQIIRTVMSEYGADGEGYSIHDAEVDEMSAAYSGPRAAYFVVLDGGVVVGGGGIGPLRGANDDVCELRKMYLLRANRGQGGGRALLETCLTTARELGYRVCYLESLTTMAEAARLYTRNGFVRLTSPLGATGHSGADSWYACELYPASMS